MRKFYYLLLLASMTLQGTNAQTEKQLLKANTSGTGITFEYNEQGLMSKTVRNLNVPAQEYFIEEYQYAPDKITATHVETPWTTQPDYRISTVSNGKIISERLSVNSSFNYNYAFSYDASNQLMKIAAGEDANTKEYEYVLSWTNGNITSIKHYHLGQLNGEVQIDYYADIDNKYLQAIIHPLHHVLDYENMVPYGQMFGDFYGAMTKNLPKSVKYIAVPGASYFAYSPDDDYTIQYVGGENGYFEKVIVTTGGETSELLLEWVSSTGISTAPMNARTPEAFYNVSGVRRQSLQRGLNIVKSSDGSVRKMIVR